MKVTGSVVSGGTPQATVTVGFIPVAVPDNTGSEAATTDAAGKFEATLLPGTYKVILSKKVDQSGNVPGPDQDVGQLEADGQLKESMPAALSDPGTTTLGAEVPSGGGELPAFEVPAAG